MVGPECINSLFVLNLYDGSELAWITCISFIAGVTGYRVDIVVLKKIGQITPQS